MRPQTRLVPARLHLQSSLVSQFLLVFSWNDRLILRLHFNYVFTSLAFFCLFWKTVGLSHHSIAPVCQLILWYWDGTPSPGWSRPAHISLVQHFHQVLSWWDCKLHLHLVPTTMTLSAASDKPAQPTLSQVILITQIPSLRVMWRKMENERGTVMCLFCLGWLHQEFQWS